MSPCSAGWVVAANSRSPFLHGHRCTDLKEALTAAELRLRDGQAEVLKGNQIIEKLMVGDV